MPIAVLDSLHSQQDLFVRVLVSFCAKTGGVYVCLTGLIDDGSE